MPPHITDVHKPHSTRNTHFTGIVPPVNLKIAKSTGETSEPGSVIVLLVGMMIAIIIKAIATVETTIS